MNSGAGSSDRRRRTALTRDPRGSAVERSDEHPTPSVTRAADSRARGRARIAGLLLFGLALLIYAGTVLRVPLPDSHGLDLEPSPDGEHYLAGAVSLYRHHQFVLALAGQLPPPRYPFGYSLLMLPIGVTIGRPARRRLPSASTRGAETRFPG